MRWTAPIEVFMNVALILWVIKIISHPPEAADTQRTLTMNWNLRAKKLTPAS